MRLFLAALAVVLLLVPVQARDNGAWEASPEHVRQWFRSLMQPDNPARSCCGEADAYWADSFEVVDGVTIATITDDRDDAPLGRQHIPNGTRVPIPNYKLKYDRGNPTGHGVVFIGAVGTVYCYVAPGGV